VQGAGEPTGNRPRRAASPTGRHRGRQAMPAPVALTLSVAGLLGAFGLGAALLPASLTGSGSAAERPEAAVAALAPGAGGGVPGARSASPSAPAAAPTTTAPATKPAAKPKPKPSATRTTTAAQPKPRATTKRTTESAPEVGSDQVSQENEVIRLVNVERDRAGCGSVELNTKLRTAMRLHVEELGRHDGLYISHVSDDGRSFVDRAKEQGYDDPGGENVARGQRNAADVMESWMNSDGHRANILNCDFKAIGVGVVEGRGGSLVWGQLFGRS
jgi:uncharacterized protein YkwD